MCDEFMRTSTSDLKHTQHREKHGRWIITAVKHQKMVIITSWERSTWSPPSSGFLTARSAQVQSPRMQYYRVSSCGMTALKPFTPTMRKNSWEPDWQHSTKCLASKQQARWRTILKVIPKSREYDSSSARCPSIKQMSDEQYRNWPAYLRLIEHTWNTTIHDMTVTPFETAHGLPARSAVDTLADDGDYCAPDTMDQEGISATKPQRKHSNRY